MANKKEDKNWLEWTVTLLSTILVVATFSFLIYQVIHQEQTPPHITINLGEPQQLETYYAIPVKAENKGTKTAQKVEIEISMDTSEGEEKATIEFDYLPGKSAANGWISFKENPKGKVLRTHVLGYISP